MIDEHNPKNKKPDAFSPSGAGEGKIIENGRNPAPHANDPGNKLSIRQRFSAWRERRKAKWADTGIHDRVNVRLSAVIAVATVVYTTFAGYTLRELIKSTNAAQDAAVAAKSAADTAKATLQASQQQFRSDQRPYVFSTPKPVGQRIQPPHEMVAIAELPNGEAEVFIGIEINNIGKSPAMNLVNSPSKIFLFDPKDIESKFKAFVPDYARSGSGTLASNNVRTVPTDYKRLSPEQWKQVKAKTLAIYVMGGVKYTDIFQPLLTEPYETRYCIEYHISGLPFADCGITVK